MKKILIVSAITVLAACSALLKAQDGATTIMAGKEEVFVPPITLPTDQTAALLAAVASFGSTNVPPDQIQRMDIHIEVRTEGTNLVARIYTRYVPAGLAPLKIRVK